MTVRELIRQLSDHDQELEVYMGAPNNLDPRGWKIEGVAEYERKQTQFFSDGTEKWVTLV